MGKCRYCGQDAGFFKSKHAECEQLHLNGANRIRKIISTCFQNKEDFYLHQNELQTLRRNSFISEICNGVYYRTGGFKGQPVETTYMQRIGTGSVCLTDRNLYFHCPEKTLKIPFSRILSLDPYSNGLGVQKDGANDMPMFFENLNSWFCYNVISNLKQD